ncbi:MAG: ribonuclease Z [Bacteroidales bacterium]|nr:ribonuclease Z [Bacteroidales bacterium]
MEFTLKIMGSASAMPVVGRNQSAQVLDVHGRFFLLDCGEGVQSQLIRYRVPILKIDSLFISHVHGDHVFGLFGLLSTMGMKGRTAPVNIYGPVNLGPILKFFLSYYGDGLAFEIRFTPLKMKSPEVIYQTRSLEVEAFPLNHKIETFGYLIREKTPQFNIRKPAIAGYGLTLTEIGTLKRGEDVHREDGSVIKVEDAAYLPYTPRSYAYVSDTAPFPELPEWVKGVDLLYHETTYLNALADQAEKRFHSTTVQAAECALKAGVRKLVIGHYSSRCDNSALYEKECRKMFPETYAASDGDVFDVPLEKLEQNI